MKVNEDSIALDSILPPNQAQNQLLNMTHQLVCHRNVTSLLSDNTQPLDTILNAFVHLIPEAWQYSDITCVRLTIGKDEFTSTNFSESKWNLVATINLSMVEIGKLEVFYLETRQDQFHGPFLQGECILMETLANELSHFIERRELIQLQQRQHKELELYSSLLRHDIKNDLGVILANIDLARMLNQSSDVDMKEIYNSTEYVCDRMMNLLNVFTLSEYEVSQNILEIIEKIVERSQKIHTSLTINLISNSESESLLIPRSTLLPLVFENLLRNSAVHGGNDCTVKIELTKSERKILIRYSDDGEGVSDEVKDKLFQKGVSTKGGGLGLFLSKQVVETMGGTIELGVSKKGEGAVFEVNLPLAILANGGS